MLPHLKILQWKVTFKFERQEPHPSRSLLLWGDSPEFCVADKLVILQKLWFCVADKLVILLKLWFQPLSNAMHCDLECAKQSVTEGAFESASHNFLNFSRSQKLISGSWRNKPCPPVSPILKKWIRRGNQSFCVSQVLCCFWHSGRGAALPKRRWP